MKKVLVIVLALLMVLPFVSCGSSKSDDMLSKALEYAKEEGLEYIDIEVGYDDLDWVEDEYGIEGKLTMMAWLEGDDFEAQIYEFENADDAKEAQELFEDDDWMEEMSSDGDYIVVRKGNTVVFGEEDFVNYITK